MMNRYANIGPADTPSLTEGDDGWVGIDSYQSPENLPPGIAQAATNIDFTSNDAVTRGGFVCIPELGNAPFDAASLWTSRTTPAGSNPWVSIAFNGLLFAAVSEAGLSTQKAMTSSDGISWTLRTTPNAGYSSICAGDGLFVAVGLQLSSDPSVMTSADGVTWTARTPATTGVWEAVRFGDGLFVAVKSSGTGNRVMTSPDGITWTSRTSASDSDWQALAHGNGTYVAVGNSGGLAQAMYSTDGITWTLATTVGSGSWVSIEFGNNTFVATGSGGQVMTSPDGITWTLRTAAAANSWNGICHGNSLFVAVASSGTNRVMTSPDGITWTSRSAASANSWRGVTNANNTFVAVASDAATNDAMTCGATLAVWASGVFSDPNSIGSNYIMLVGTTKVGFYAFGRTSKTVNIDAAQTVSELSTVVQANNKVYIFRGASEVPLVWDGSWATEFELATGSIVNSNQAVFVQNRLWVKNGKDTISASDVLGFTVFNALDNSVNIGKGDSTYTVTTFPFGDTTLIIFKNRSIIALTEIDGSLTDIVATEVTRQLGAIGINSVCSVGPDLVYVSDRNINLLSLTQTNNALQPKTLPLSTPIKKIFDRVNWEYGYKISLGYSDNKLYVALPLDNATVCNTVCVYNFITGQWFGEWNFNASLGMAIQGWQVATYLGLQRLHAITEDGRIFVTDEGPQDISGTNVFEIAASLTTRAYRVDNNNRVNRRMWADLGTWRPSFSVTGYVDGAGESSEILTDQELSRSQSWVFNDSSYSLTNSGDNYNRQGRKDYAGYCSDSIQAQSGFLPETLQEYRYPLVFRRSGRLVWFRLDNTQGKISINGIGSEARSGDRSNRVQVI